jgi:hypothetical protein
MDAQPETTTPIEEKDSFNWRMFVLWPLVIVLLYFLSFGPVMMMRHKGHISGSNQFVDKFYLPIWWTYYNTPLHEPLRLYMHLWIPIVFDENGG